MQSDSFMNNRQGPHGSGQEATEQKTCKIISISPNNKSATKRQFERCSNFTWSQEAAPPTCNRYNGIFLFTNAFTPRGRETVVSVTGHFEGIHPLEPETPMPPEPMDVEQPEEPSGKQMPEIQPAAT